MTGNFAAEDNILYRSHQFGNAPLDVSWFNHERTRDMASRRFQLSPDGRQINFTAPHTANFTTGDGLSGTIAIDVDGIGIATGLEILGGKLLVVCRFGFLLLDPLYDPAEFRIQTYAHSPSEIISNTAKVLGDSVFFATWDGLCECMPGGRIRRLDIDIPLTQAWLAARTLNGRYCLLFERGRMLLIERFHDSHFFLAAPQLGEPRVWQSGEFQLGYGAGRQFMKQIRIRTNAPLTIIASTESRDQRIEVSAAEGIQRINTNLKGETFRIRIETNERNVEITDIAAVIGFAVKRSTRWS